MLMLRFRYVALSALLIACKDLRAPAAKPLTIVVKYRVTSESTSYQQSDETVLQKDADGKVDFSMTVIAPTEKRVRILKDFVVLQIRATQPFVEKTWITLTADSTEHFIVFVNPASLYGTAKPSDYNFVLPDTLTARLAVANTVHLAFSHDYFHVDEVRLPAAQVSIFQQMCWQSPTCFQILRAKFRQSLSRTTTKP